MFKTSLVACSFAFMFFSCASNVVPSVAPNDRSPSGTSVSHIPLFDWRRDFDPAKKTVCTVTINSSDEANEFVRSLPTRDFQFVELFDPISGFVGADSARLSCDIFVFSGHFGGSFFGTQGGLKLSDLESKSCEPHARNIFHQAKEVFLFGCNTLAGKEKDTRTPQDYLNVLTADHIPSEIAQQVVALRYSPIGNTFAAEMQSIFLNAKRIYGFNSISPRGSTSAQLLKRYFNGRAENYSDYLDHLDRTNNEQLKLDFGQTTFVQVSGLEAQQSPRCLLQTGRKSVVQKLDWIKSQMLDSSVRLVSLFQINKFFEDLREVRHKWTADETAHRKQISMIQNLKRDLEVMADGSLTSLPVVRVEVLKLLHNLDLLTTSDYSKRLEAILPEQFSADFDESQRTAICALDASANVSASRVPESLWSNISFLNALTCLRPQNADVQFRVGRVIASSVGDTRVAAIRALGSMNPSSPQLRRQFIKLLQEKDLDVLTAAADESYDIHLDDPALIDEAISLLGKQNKFQRRAGLGLLTDASVVTTSQQERLLSLIGISTTEVRLDGIMAMSRLKNASHSVILFLMESLKSPDLIVQRQAIRALGKLRNSSEDVKRALTSLINSETYITTTEAIESLAKLEATDEFVIMRLAEVSDSAYRPTRRVILDQLFEFAPLSARALELLKKKASGNYIEINEDIQRTIKRIESKSI